MTGLLLCVALALPTPPGWKATSELETHETRAAIYAAINGAADFYFAYGLEEMRVREYGRDDVDLELEIYELGATLDAFGVLQRQRSRAATAVDVGNEAAVTDTSCIARRGRFYLRAKAFRGKLTAGSCKDFLGPVVASLEAGSDPAELERLPLANRVPGSVGFTRERYLGLSALARCVHADYTAGDSSYRAFVMVNGDWKTLSSWDAVAGGPQPMVRREIPYTGWVAVAQTEHGLIGVVSDDAESVVERLRLLLAPPQPKKR